MIAINREKTTIAKLFGAGLILVSIIFSMSINMPQSEAISGIDWKAGDIISDTNFYDNTQMSAGSIQQWLTNNLTCDTDGTKRSEFSGGTDLNKNGVITRSEWAQSTKNYSGKFVCLTDYRENPTTGENNLITGVSPTGSLSAAEIIKKAADDHKINPKVLLVKIRKESPGPLTGDEWPWPQQYTAALGYACPDPPEGQPVVCDPNYAGFYKQVHNAARGLRNYVTYASSYRYKVNQQNSIYYNPDTACGASMVYISNYATAGLYNYTPYQPNKAALDNLYGEGDGCSAYGNRNFWTMYSNMFGSTTTARVGNKQANNSAYAQSPCTIPMYDSTNVLRLYQPDIRNFLYTTSRAEACQAVSYGFIFDGPVMKDARGEANTMPVYRLSNYERHLFTPSSSVRDSYIADQGYKDEGIAFYVYASQVPDSIPVSGLQKDQTFFFTSAGKETELYGGDGYFNFGTIFYTKNLAPSPTPVYRITNKQHTRLYTSSSLERDVALKSGFIDEGTITTNDSAPNPANMPLYRLRSPWGTYFYTASRHERDLAVINYGYYSEGVGFYVLMYSNNTAYRALNPATAQRIFTNSRLEYDLAQSRHGYIGEGIGWYGY